MILGSRVICAAGLSLLAPAAAWAVEPASALPEPSLGSAVIEMLGGLALVLAILIGLYWALRRFAPGRAAGRSMGGLRLVGRLPLGPRKYLGLVKVADKVLVIGVSEASITTLAIIDDPEQVALLSAGDKKAFGKAMAAAGGGAEKTK